MAHFTATNKEYLCEVSCDYSASNPLQAANTFLEALRDSSEWLITVIDKSTGEKYNVNIPLQQLQ